MELLLNRQKLCTMCILDTCLIKKKGKNSKVAVLISTLINLPNYYQLLCNNIKTPAGQHYYKKQFTITQTSSLVFSQYVFINGSGRIGKLPLLPFLSFAPLRHPTLVKCSPATLSISIKSPRLYGIMFTSSVCLL